MALNSLKTHLFGLWDHSALWHWLLVNWRYRNILTYLLTYLCWSAVNKLLSLTPCICPALSNGCYTLLGKRPFLPRWRSRMLGRRQSRSSCPPLAWSPGSTSVHPAERERGGCQQVYRWQHDHRVFTLSATATARISAKLGSARAPRDTTGTVRTGYR